MKTLVLGLGNELLGDDGVGVLAARELAGQLDGLADVVECNLHGMALLDVMLGYNQLIIADAIHTGEVPPGTIIELKPSDFKAVPFPSPHYAGLPDLIVMADQLGLDFPREIVILAVEIADAHTIGKPLSPPIAGALKDLISRVKTQLYLWFQQGGCPGSQVTSRSCA